MWKIMTGLVVVFTIMVITLQNLSYSQSFQRKFSPFAAKEAELLLSSNNSQA